MVHSGEGDGWDPLRQSMSSVLISQGRVFLIDAHPNWTVDRMREELFKNADWEYGGFGYDPTYVHGYGVVNAFATHDNYASEAGELGLDREVYPCEDPITFTVVDLGLNTDPGLVETTTTTVSSESEPAGETVIPTEEDADSPTFVGTIDISAGGAPGVLQVADGNTVTAIYIDEDNGQGGYGVEFVPPSAGQHHLHARLSQSHGTSLSDSGSCTCNPRYLPG